MLNEAGFEVSEAENGSDALQRLSYLGAVDLVLVDWNMPIMNGFEFIRTIRADEKYRDMRIIMVTTETGSEEMSMALEAGADEYVMKPFTKDDILQKIQMLGI